MKMDGKLKTNKIVPVYFEYQTALNKMEEFLCESMGSARCSSSKNCPCFRDYYLYSEVCRCLINEDCKIDPMKFGNDGDDSADGIN